MTDRLTNFAASVVHLQEDEHVAMVGLANDRLSATKFIILQRALRPSDHDIALGHDAVHVTVRDQDRSGYGGLTRVSATSSQIVFAFDERAAEQLRVSQELVVDVSATAVDHAALVSQLRNVCGEYVPVVVVAVD